MQARLTLITALLCCANAAALTPAGAGPVDWDAARAAGLPKLAEAATPTPVPDTPFLDAEGREVSLADWKGKALLVNFWATWCAPCRKEMPSLDALQAEDGGKGFEVLTIASGRNPPPAIAKFFAEENITHLPALRDERQALARQMGVLGLPVSVLIDAQGREVARLIGDADWSAPAARAVVSQLAAP